MHPSFFIKYLPVRQYSVSFVFFSPAIMPKKVKKGGGKKGGKKSKKGGISSNDKKSTAQAGQHGSFLIEAPKPVRIPLPGEKVSVTFLLRIYVYVQHLPDFVCTYIIIY